MVNIRTLIKTNYQQVLFVFLAFLTMVLVSYFYVGNIVQEQMLAIGQETMNATQTAVSASLLESELTFANVTQNVEQMVNINATNEQILDYLSSTNAYFKTELSPLPDFLKIYAYLHEEFLDGSGWVPPDDYRPWERVWYLGAVDTGGIYFSEPYEDADTGGMCISFSREIVDQDGVFHGVLAIDLNLTRITDYISGQQIANNGYGVLLDDELRFTSHRDIRLVGVPISEVGESYRAIGSLIERGGEVDAHRFTDVDGTDSIAFFRTVFNGWHIGIIIPRESYYKPVYDLAKVLSVLGLVLMVALSYLLVRTRVAKMRSDEESLSKSSFLARMSHEMRTPMNAIIGMTNIARRSDDMEKVQENLEKIDNAANHLLGVINDVLDMSKIEAGKLELSKTGFRFTSVIDQVVTVTGYKVEEKHQNLIIQVDDNVPEFIVQDKQRLAQIITNLLSNANKFTPEGGNIKILAHRVETPGEPADSCTLQIEVADDGIGISKEHQARLFNSFEQADNSISRKYGGTGLGLAISKRIVELMDGEAWIDSELGKGARFIFTIRAGIVSGETSEPDAQTPGADQVEDLSGLFLGKRILLAEDIQINREILLALLEETGVDIDLAVDGVEVVNMFMVNPHRYDLIFMDVHMPLIDGYEATMRIRSLGYPMAEQIPIVAMTANVFREDIEKCLDCGMNDHVGKPIDPDRLIAVMKKYLL